MQKGKTASAFTIVELMIAIVLIAVLAGFVVVGFNGVRDKAIIAAIEQELRIASSKLEANRMTHDSELYATDLTEAGIVASADRSFSYNVSEDQKEYCLASTNGKKTYFVTNERQEPTPGICDGAVGIEGTGNVAQDLAPSVPTVLASSSALMLTWPETTCLSGMTPSYKWNWQVVGGASGSQSSWTTTREQEVSGEGAQVTGTLYTRCNLGDDHTAEVSAPFDVLLPVLTVPTMGAINVGNDGNATWSASGCPANTALQYQWRRDVSSEPGGYGVYTAWANETSAGVTIDYGEQVTYQVQARCRNGSTDVSGLPASATSSVFTRSLATPTSPNVTVSTSSLQFSWPAVTCAAGTTASYRWNWQIVGGTSGTQASWTTTRTQTVSSAEGAQINGTVYARCSSGSNHSAEVSGTFNDTLPVLSTPTIGTISIASDSNASWSASGCPAGTSVQYQWRRDTAREAGGYNSYTSWGTGTSSGVTIGQDDQVTYQVQARCRNASTDTSGPVAAKTSSLFTRGISTPNAPTWVRHVVSNNTTMVWNATSCAAGYPVYQMWIVNRSSGATQWSFGPSTATSAVRPSLPVANWNSHLRAYCQGTYATSAWSAENIAYT